MSCIELWQFEWAILLLKAQQESLLEMSPLAIEETRKKYGRQPIWSQSRKQSIVVKKNSGGIKHRLQNILIILSLAHAELN